MLNKVVCLPVCYGIREKSLIPRILMYRDWQMLLLDVLYLTLPMQRLGEPT